jgi:hypothetical protein
MNQSEQQLVSPAEQLPFTAQVAGMNASLGDRVPTFDEFSAAHVLADQMNYDKTSNTYTGPDGTFVDPVSADNLKKISSESTWLLNENQQLAYLKARTAVDETLRGKAMAAVNLDQSIRAANKADAQEHAQNLHQERLDLIANKDAKRLETIKQEQLAIFAKDRTDQLLWKTAFNNGGTRLHGTNRELRTWVHDIAKKQAVGELLDSIAAHPQGEAIARKFDAMAEASLKKEKDDKLTAAGTTPKKQEAIPVSKKADEVAALKPEKVIRLEKAARQKRLTVLRPYLERLLRADLEETLRRNAAAERTRRAA